MTDGNEKRNRQLAFELQNSHVCEKRSKTARFGYRHYYKKKLMSGPEGNIRTLSCFILILSLKEISSNQTK